MLLRKHDQIAVLKQHEVRKISGRSKQIINKKKGENSNGGRESIGMVLVIGKETTVIKTYTGL